MATLIIIVMVLCAAQYFLYSEIKIKNQKISQMQNNINSKESRQEYLLSMQKMLESLDQSVGDVDASIVPSGGDVQFIEYLGSVAKDSGLSMDIINLSLEDNSSLSSAKLNGLKVRADIEGSWKSVYSFANRLEYLPYRVKILRFSVSNSNLSSENQIQKSGSVWKGSFEIVVLKYK